MRAFELAAVIIVTGIVIGCGSSSPTSPTPSPTPTASTWALTGTVSSSVGGGIAAATVSILDGPDAGKQTTTDGGGRFSFTGLMQAGFTLRATANGYTPVSKGVTLTSNTTTDFQLPRLPVARLTFEGDLGFDARADGGYDMHATGVNTGDGCAGSIGGTTTITAGASFTYPWKLSPAVIVRPGERFQYAFGPISRSEVDMLTGASGTYITTFVFVTTACP